jgi:hypothetical protein
MSLDEEQRLRIEQMLADIDNKRADTQYKVTLTRIEPWKTVIALVAGVSVIVGVVAGLAGYKLGSTQPPAPIVIQVPAQVPPASGR